MSYIFGVFGALNFGVLVGNVFVWQIFQLLLPEMTGHNEALWLLLALSFVAPALAWASRLELRERPKTRNTKPAT